MRGRGGDGVVVTGAAGGLGRAIAAALVADGRRVWVTDRDEAAATSVADALGHGAVARELDVTDPDACRALAIEAEATDGLAVWINNAGILPTGPSWAHHRDTVATTFAVNTFGTVHGTEAALHVMRPRGHGHVVNIVSLAGLVAPPGETVYAATKHAALAYSVGTGLDLRRTGAKHVRVSAICPDGIWTPMLADKLADPEAALSWSGSLLQPARVAEVVVDVLRRPRPVVSIPRWRGAQVRAFAAFPRVGAVLAPLVMADARRRQRAFARSLRRER